MMQEWKIYFSFRYGHSCALSESDPAGFLVIIIAGGTDDNGDVIASVEAIGVDREAFIEAEPLPSPVTNAAITKVSFIYYRPWLYNDFDLDKRFTANFASLLILLSPFFLLLSDQRWHNLPPGRHRWQRKSMRRYTQVKKKWVTSSHTIFQGQWAIRSIDYVFAATSYPYSGAGPGPSPTIYLQNYLGPDN